MNKHCQWATGLVAAMAIVNFTPSAFAQEGGEQDESLGGILAPEAGEPTNADSDGGGREDPETDAASGASPADVQPTAPDSLPTVPVEQRAEVEGPPENKGRSAPRRNVLVEEIVVTAQKREENIQDVPVAVAAFSGEQLSVLGVEDTKDLAIVTPGLQFSELAGFTLIYLRGTGTDSFLPYSDPSVATYVDGLYIPAQQGLVTSFGGVERVEVLKGPQGTLFGRNSTGGAINVVTKAPNGELEVSGQGELGTMGTRKAQAYVSFPILDSLAGSISGIYNHVDAYYKLVTDDLGPGDSPPEGPIRDEESKGLRAKLHWQPSESLDLVATLPSAEGMKASVPMPRR